jgi:tetratricopeptide (TPR) repeat protein
MQDLIRGIEKIIGAQAPKAEETVTGNVEPTIAPLMKRAFIFMEDGEWAAADSYCEKVLDLDPENALAYLGKLMVELRISTQEGLKNVERSFARNGNFIKAVRYADNELKIKLAEYSKAVEDRENERLYQALIAKIGSARTQDEFLNIAIELESAQLVNYKDSLNIATDCRIKANEAYKAYTYEKAINLMNLARYDEAKVYFENVKGYMDANEYAAKCTEEIEKFRRKCMGSYQAASANVERGQDYLSAGGFAAAFEAYKSAYETFTKLATYNDSADRAKLCALELKKLEAECNPTIVFRIPLNRNPLSLADGTHYFYTLVEKTTRDTQSFDVILTRGGDTVFKERIKQGEYEVSLKVYGYADILSSASPMHAASCTISVKNFETIHITANNPGLFSGVKITTQKD